MGCSGSHADKILKIARSRDRVTASRMRHQLTLSNKRCCRVLDRHQPAWESRLRPSPDQEWWMSIVERGVQQSRYSSLRHVSKIGDRQAHDIKAHSNRLSVKVAPGNTDAILWKYERIVGGRIHLYL